MKMLKKAFGLTLMAATLAVLPLAQARAQSNMQVQPAIVISVASIDEQTNDVKHMMAAAGMAAFGDLAAGMASQYTEHFDTDLPMGGYITMDGFEPHMVGFMPVNDLDSALKMFRNELGDIDEGDNGMKIISMPRGEEVFLKEAHGYVFFAQMEEDLDDLPSDPSKMLGGLEDEYNVAVRVYAQNVPEDLKEMAIGFMEEGFDEAMWNLEQVDPDAAALQSEMNKVTMQSMVEMIQQLDELTIGISVDEESQSTYLDFTITGVPDSKLADQISQAGQIDSNFTGFLQAGAAATMHFTSKMSDEDVAGVDQMFEGMKEQILGQIEDEAGLNSQEAELASRVVGELMDVMEKTLRGGVLDGGAAVMLEDDTVALAAGMTVVDGLKIEELAKELVGIIEGEAPPEVEFNLDAETYSGVDMHVITIPVPDDEEDVQKMFGDEITIVLGTSDDAVYFALGKNCISLLKSCMDDSKSGSSEDLPNSQFTLSLGKVMQFAANMQDDQVTELLAEALEGSENDHIRIVSSTVKNGARTRIEIEDDIIKLIGVAGMQLGGDFGPGF